MMFFPSPIAIKFSSVIDYELKFVKTRTVLKAYCQPWCIARREHKAIRSKKIVIRSSGSG